MQEACGLKPRAWAALYLSDERLQNQQKIADALDISRNAMVKLVDQLEKKGYLKRVPNLDDRRQHLLKVTPKGSKACRAGMKAVTSMQAEAFEKLTPEEVTTLQGILLKLLD